MADMSDVLEVLTSIENYLIDLPTKIILRANQIFIVNGLSDVSENLGIVTAGEFRAGNRNEPGMFLRTAVVGSGFSGMRMRYPAMSYDLDGTPTDWNLVGINDDILQFGVRASDGKLVAGGGAVILDSTGITAVGGTIAGWTIDTTELTNTKIKISSAGSIESIPFVSGVGGSGWKISESGDVEFNNAVIRGEIRTTVLTYQEVQAVSGTMGVFHSAGVLSQDLTLPAVPSGTYTIWTKAPNSTNPKIFDNNHILQIKNGTQSTWFIIDGGYNTGGDGYQWVCTYLSGTTDVTYTTGQAVISYGVSGDGFLLMEAIGTGSPYFSVRTHAGAPYTANTEHVRMGNLNGNWGYAADVYGVAIGQYATGKGNITVDPTDGIKINIYTDNIMQFNSSGAFITNVLNMSGDDAAIAIGNPPPASAVSGTGIWLDRNGLHSLASGVYQVKIDATDGKLYAGGGLTIIDKDGINLMYSTIMTKGASINWRDKLSLGMYLDGTGAFGQLSLVDQRATLGTIASTDGSGGTNPFAENRMIAMHLSNFIAFKVIADSTGVRAELLNGNLRVNSGTANNPGYTFNYRTNTGIYSPLANQIGFTTGGVERVRIANGLYVGSNGIAPSSGEIIYDGVLKSYKNSTDYTGYIFVPLTTPLTSTSYDGGDTVSVGTTSIDTSSVFSAPAGIKGVMIQISGVWSSANNGYYAALRPKSGSTNVMVIRAQVANINSDMTGFCPCDSNGDLDLVVAGADMSNTVLRIHGYFI